MKFAIKALDEAYTRYPGDSLSSRYDDYGYSTWDLEQADLYDNLREAELNFHKDGKFSEKEGAKIVGVTFAEQEFHIEKLTCDSCEGKGKIYDDKSGNSITCFKCNGNKIITKIVEVALKKGKMK